MFFLGILVFVPVQCNQNPVPGLSTGGCGSVGGGGGELVVVEDGGEESVRTREGSVRYGGNQQSEKKFLKSLIKCQFRITLNY